MARTGRDTDFPAQFYGWIKLDMSLEELLVDVHDSQSIIGVN